MNAPKRQRKSHEERRVEIARAALELAGEGGVGLVTTQAIADRLGLSQATVFRHFESRDQVFLEAVRQIQAGVFGHLQPFFEDPNASPKSKLINVLQEHLSYIQDNRGIPALLFSDRLHRDDPALKDAVRQMMKAYAGKIAGLIQAGVEAGEFRAGTDANLTALAIVTMIQGLVLRWSLFDGGFDLKVQDGVVWALVWPALKPSTD